MLGRASRDVQQPGLWARAAGLGRPGKGGWSLDEGLNRMPDRMDGEGHVLQPGVRDWPAGPQGAPERTL